MGFLGHLQADEDRMVQLTKVHLNLFACNIDAYCIYDIILRIQKQLDVCSYKREIDNLLECHRNSCLRRRKIAMF